MLEWNTYYKKLQKFGFVGAKKMLENPLIQYIYTTETRSKTLLQNFVSSGDGPAKKRYRNKAEKAR